MANKTTRIDDLLVEIGSDSQGPVIRVGREGGGLLTLRSPKEARELSAVLSLAAADLAALMVTDEDIEEAAALGDIGVIYDGLEDPPF